jgi:hypothetical protein
MEETNTTPNEEYFDWIESFLTSRENEELTFAVLYAYHFHHGTDGHNRLMLLSKLNDLLETMWSCLTDEQQEHIKQEKGVSKE